jgi:Ca2+-binding RTX toxin-like protein
MWIGHFSMIENATGSRHNDTLIGNELKNVILGGAGKDTIQAQAGDDRLFGEGGNDVLEAGAGDDVLYGGPGNDIFEGGAGADVIHLGGGSNRVVVKAITHMGTPEAPDRILSFSGSDKIDFRKIDGSSDQKGDQKLKFLGNSNTDMVLAGKRSGQFYFNTDSRDLRFDADADGTVDRVIEIPDMKAMKAAYFLL